jgi:ferredoxin
MSAQPRCLIDRSRPCGGCVASCPADCPYGYLLADEETLHRRFGHPDPKADHTVTDHA